MRASWQGVRGSPPCRSQWRSASCQRRRTPRARRPDGCSPRRSATRPWSHGSSMHVEGVWARGSAAARPVEEVLRSSNGIQVVAGQQELEEEINWYHTTNARAENAKKDAEPSLGQAADAQTHELESQIESLTPRGLRRLTQTRLRSPRNWLMS